MPRSGPSPTTWDNVRAEGAELSLDAGGRAMGNAGAQDTEGGRALVPGVQRRLDRATAHIDLPRWVAARADLLTEAFTAHSPDTDPDQQSPLPPSRF